MANPVQSASQGLVRGLTARGGLNEPYFTAVAFTVTASSLDIGNSGNLVQLNHGSTKIEAVIKQPVPGKFLVLTQTDSGTSGHTVTLTVGTFQTSYTSTETDTVATFNNQYETLVLYGLSSTKWLIVLNIGSVGLA